MDVEAATGLPVGPVVDTRPALRPQSIVVEGQHVRLQPLDAERHADDLFGFSQGEQNAALWTYLFDAPASDLASFRQLIAERAASRDPLFCAIVERTTGKAVGMASLMRIDEKNRVIEVGNILFTPALQRKAGATEAMYLLMKHVFEDLGYRRYEWKCNSLNAPSRQAALRLGFVFEGVFRQHMFVKGRNRDTAWFSMLDREWPARKQAFEKWLEPANFDAQGRQRQPLHAFAVPAGEQTAFGGLLLRRAGAGDQPAVEKLQADAYHRNQVLIGVMPIPLSWDYAEKLASCETWLLEGTHGLDAVLMLSVRAQDLYIESIAVSPLVQATGSGTVLLDFAAARCRHHARAVLRLATNAKLVRNIAWYARKGYVVEHEEILVDRNVVHMAKHI